MSSPNSSCPYLRRLFLIKAQLVVIIGSNNHFNLDLILLLSSRLVEKAGYDIRRRHRIVLR